jgi:MerR family transcriptional regulator, mercuric resistance operon regulatory protein
MPEGLTIGRLAKAVGVNVETIRYYQRRGLIAEPAKPPGGHRRYSPRVIEQIHFIRRAQQLGFSLDEAKTFLGMADGSSCREARIIAEKKYELIEIQLARLEKMRAELEVLIEACRANRSRTHCPLIDALKQGR